MNILEELEWRGLINDVTDRESFEKMVQQEIKVYLGIDPTADSLHIGHLSPVVMLKRFQNFGHIPVPLMGGGTGRIGDPSGRASERQLLSIEEINSNVANIRKQVEMILDTDVENKPLFLDNATWGSKISMFDFLRDYGKFFNINYMLAKDSIASRLDSGLSFTEFSYTILQALDWLVMYEQYGVNMQIGGSDQWGNFTSGLELIRKKHPDAKPCVGLTMPLITKADGTKFGKSASGAIWLDPKKTSPYEFYQFFLNSADADVIKYLKVFTFLTQEEITAIKQEMEVKAHERLAQKTLAKEVTIMIHGQEAFDNAIKISQALFSGDIKSLNIDEIKASFNGVPKSSVSEDLNIIDFLIETSICKSKREAREFVTGNSITINGDKVTDLEFIVKKEDAFNQEVTIVRRGKKNYYKIDHI